MNTEERSALVNEFRASGQSFLAGTSGLTDAQGKFKPAPDRWSIEECVEHLAVVEKWILYRISEDYTPSDRVERPDRQAELRQFGASRASKRQAPERVRPTGQFGSLAKALDQFAASREQTIAYLSACQNDLNAGTVVHPTLGPMTCHEYVIFMTGHTLRHLDQIREIQASPGFPA
ncbi:MAG TPA: DinB family protein [Candidatus Acidoferrales bacterium]|nr:DinB family protein [Candidatus Acidoferrales bacterium]